MGVAAQIFNDVGSPFEGFLEMGNPFLGIEGREKIIELGRVSEHSLGEGNIQLSTLVEGFQSMEKFSAEEF